MNRRGAGATRARNENLLEAVVDLIMPDGTKAADLRSAADDNTAKNDMALNFIISVRQFLSTKPATQQRNSVACLE
jgi:hypothetical protein